MLSEVRPPLLANRVHSVSLRSRRVSAEFYEALIFTPLFIKKKWNLKKNSPRVPSGHPGTPTIPPHLSHQTKRMELISLPKEQFEQLLQSIEQIKAKLVSKPDFDYIDNYELMQMLKLSKRCAQAWRDEGKIPFSRIGNKVYYKLSDVQALLDKHYMKVTWQWKE
jgi:hypothetical protein